MARYLIDANLPRWFSLWSGEDCEFVHDIGADWSDTRIWDYARNNHLTIVSKDADFSNRVVLTDSGPHVIHIRGPASLSVGSVGGDMPRERDEPPRAGLPGSR